MVAIRNLGQMGVPIPYQYSAQDLGTPEQESYGHKMRRLRLELALTQREVAEILGCSPITLSLWERGKRMGNSAEAAALPRRAIELLSQRLRRKQRRDGVDSVGVARQRPSRRVATESVVPVPEGRLRRG